MKTINKFRNTKTYCINDIKFLARVYAKFGDTIIAIAHEAKDDLAVYTVRISYGGDLVDYKINAMHSDIRILESKNILTASDVKLAKEILAR